MAGKYRDNPDDPEEADNFVDDIPRNPNDYTSVNVDDDDYSGDDYRGNGHGRRRRRYRKSPSSGAYCCSWACLCGLCCGTILFLGLLLGLAVAFILYERNLHPDGVDWLRLVPAYATNNDTMLDNNTSNNNVSSMDALPLQDNDNNMTTGNDTMSSTAKSFPSHTVASGNLAKIVYNETATVHAYNPFAMGTGDWYGASVVPPPPPTNNDDDDTSSSSPLGYLTQPNVHDDTLVFVAEGDLYMSSTTTTTTTSSTPTTAFKLTTTVGNVQTPTINPSFPYLIAYTATYTGQRDVYLLDLRVGPKNHPSSAMRLTYQGSIRRIVGWKDNGSTLVYSVHNQEIGLPDERLYEMTLSTTPTNDNNDRSLLEPQPHSHDTPQQSVLTGAPSILSVTPVPLAQALDGVWNSNDSCLFFTRYTQSSHTIRYTGGTAPNLWAYCHGAPQAVPLTPNYRGTSKTPKIGTVQGKDYLFFLSDRDPTTQLEPASMNLWAVPVPTKQVLDEAARTGTSFDLTSAPQMITQVSCWYNGLSLVEYDIDTANGNIVLRIGADLYILPADTVLSDSLSGDSPAQKLSLAVYSDFHELHERLVHNIFPSKVSTVDVFDTAFGTTAALLTVRGQLFVAPVLPDSDLPDYNGSGQNLPPRRYRVAPGTLHGGIVRILASKYVTIPQEQDHTSTRRLAVLLATDPNSPTAEHGFYLIEVQSDSAPAFVDWPEPFAGGHMHGGSVAEGGLGSVYPDSVTVSPCGRRLAWTNTDGQIVVMTLPLYQTDVAGDDYLYHNLPTSNEQGEPMVDATDLSFSPGGRYLTVTHSARNQFRIISIVDLGDPERNGTDQVAEIDIGRVVQATPARFNCRDATWGKTPLDFGLSKFKPLQIKLEKDNDDDDDVHAATTLYFLSDRDIVSDVRSPWGTRAPSPHFAKNRWDVYALPLLVHNSPINPRHGLFAGGGASELWADDILAVRQQLDALDKAKKQRDEQEYSTGQRSEGRRLTQQELVSAAAVRRHERLSRMVGKSRTRRLQTDPFASDTEKDQEDLQDAPQDTVNVDDADAVEDDDPDDVQDDNPGDVQDDDGFEFVDDNADDVPDNEKSPALSPSLSSPTDTGNGNDESYSMAPTYLTSPLSPVGTIPTPNVASEPTSLPTAYEGPADSPTGTIPTPAVTQTKATVPSATDTNDGTSSLAANDVGNTETTPVPSATPSSSPTKTKVAETPTPSAKPLSEPSASPSVSPSNVPSVEPTDSQVPSSAPSSTPEPPSPFTKDLEIDFGDTVDLTFARRAYRINGIPTGDYAGIIGQLQDDPSLVLVQNAKDGDENNSGMVVVLMNIDDYPGDGVDVTPVAVKGHRLIEADISSTGEHLYFTFRPGVMKVVPNTVSGITSFIADAKGDMSQHIVDTDLLAVRVWPTLEYEQMFNDAWRMLRDYFYDTQMNGVFWEIMHDRYHGLVRRCAKREDLDDILSQMASELSALHVFVYGGEYNNPLHGNAALSALEEPASLGASLRRSEEWRGYVVTSVAHIDPDFDKKDDDAVYSPLCHHVLRLTGQRGLEPGDVIVGINGESVLRVPDIGMLLRGTAGRSIRLDVIRVGSAEEEDKDKSEDDGTDSDGTDDTDAESESGMKPEALIVVPITQDAASNLRYLTWEYNTRKTAVAMAEEKGFSVGYLHLRSMSGPEDVNQFFRGFFPSYDKMGLIVDVRHNRGGNIDSWLLDILQRKAFYYWQSRATNIHNGGEGWNEMFAFRGHLVVLIDEKTSSDGESFARGVSELGLGKLVGRRTWGGGIWLSSDNHLVDGGIATAPEIGVYNDHFGWGGGIEQHGVDPDIEVDNDPRLTYDGKDQQLEKAIEVLDEWIRSEPVAFPKEPGPKKDMSLKGEVESCAA